MANPFATTPATPPRHPAPNLGMGGSDPAAQARAMLAGLESAPVYGSGQYIIPGDYYLELRELRLHQSAKAAGRIMLIAEWQILEAQVHDRDQADSYAPGATATHVINLSHASAKSNIKALMMALVPDLAEDQVTNDVVIAAAGPAQPCSGFRVRCTATNIKTQSGGDFTRVTYRADAQAGSDGDGSAPADL